MKKTILYLSLVSTLAIPQGMATEGDQNQEQNLGHNRGQIGNAEFEAQEIARLQEELANALEDKRKETESKEAEQQKLAVISEEQRETKELLDAVLTQHHQIREGTLFNVVNGVEPLSACQQQLLPRREQIGEKAWSALGGDHLSLAAALFQAIQGLPGRNVEISCLKVNNFKLCVDEDIQKRSYKF